MCNDVFRNSIVHVPLCTTYGFNSIWLPIWIYTEPLIQILYTVIIRTAPARFQKCRPEAVFSRCGATLSQARSGFPNHTAGNISDSLVAPDGSSGGDALPFTNGGRAPTSSSDTPSPLHWHGRGAAAAGCDLHPHVAAPLPLATVPERSDENFG